MAEDLDWFGVFNHGPIPHAVFPYADLAQQWIAHNFTETRSNYRVERITRPVVQKVTIVKCPKCDGTGQLRALESPSVSRTAEPNGAAQKETTEK